jgi:hypothetical protein
MQNSTAEMSRAAHAPQLKPKAYWPMLADWLLAMKALRALTKVALSFGR